MEVITVIRPFHWDLFEKNTKSGIGKIRNKVAPLPFNEFGVLTIGDNIELRNGEEEDSKTFKLPFVKFGTAEMSENDSYTISAVQIPTGCTFSFDVEKGEITIGYNGNSLPDNSNHLLQINMSASYQGRQFEANLFYIINIKGEPVV